MVWLINRDVLNLIYVIIQNNFSVQEKLKSKNIIKFKVKWFLMYIGRGFGFLMIYNYYLK